jgi:hypothetical protein
MKFLSFAMPHAMVARIAEHITQTNCCYLIHRGIYGGMTGAATYITLTMLPSTGYVEQAESLIHGPLTFLYFLTYTG